MCNNILEDREKRYGEILSLLDEYNMPVLCGKINYPGENKNTEEVMLAFRMLVNILKEGFNNQHKHIQILNGHDGPALLMVLNMDGLKAKEAAVKLEDHNKIGRIFDIDIYAENGYSIGRSDLGIRPRGCILCEDEGRVCTRLQRHSLQQVLGRINSIIKEYGEGNE